MCVSDERGGARGNKVVFSAAFAQEPGGSVSRVVRLNRNAAAAPADEDDPYKEFKIPDDFDW